MDVVITPGTHASELASKFLQILFYFFISYLPPTVNKQLADKERVAAALENVHLLNVVNQCINGEN